MLVVVSGRLHETEKVEKCKERKNTVNPGLQEKEMVAAYRLIYLCPTQLHLGAKTNEFTCLTSSLDNKESDCDRDYKIIGQTMRY